MSGVVDFDDYIDQVYRIKELESLPHSDLKSLYKQAISELKDLRLEFDEF